MKKPASKKVKSSEKHSRNLQDTPLQAALEEIKQRKVLDLRRWSVPAPPPEHPMLCSYVKYIGAVCALQGLCLLSAL